MASFLERYRAGERQLVWDELLKLGEGALTRPHREGAWAVACETMHRARSNVEKIYARLKQAGYQFQHPEWAWNPATPEDIEAVREIESKVGPMPLSLRAWYEIVGSVWWTGHHAVWDSFGSETDALVITPVSHIRDECEEWLSDHEERYEEYGRYFHVEISPDRLHKADISGGPPYAIACGIPCVDGLVKEENRRLNFVPYLRVCFEYGGFPGFEGYQAGDNSLLKGLASGLLEI